MLSADNYPKITFGMIVLNGEPFIRYNLRSLYPFAHQIIVVEGACQGAAGVATPDGHSIDSTLETIRAFKRDEDLESKVMLVTAEQEGHPNGFWPGEKHEQSQSYAKRATGNWLWQVDVDEFYKDKDVKYIHNLLKIDPSITAISLPQITFWGGIKYACDSWYLRRGLGLNCPRIFTWGTGYKYITHRPPTVHNSNGDNLQLIKPSVGNWFKNKGIYFYHYSLIFPCQILAKGEYYKNAPHAKRNGWYFWMENSYLSLKKPYRVHNIYESPSWLKRFSGEHPEQVKKMMADIQTGILKVELRSTDDVEALLSSWWYPLGRSFLIFADHPMRFLSWFYNQLKRIKRIPMKLRKLFPERNE